MVVLNMLLCYRLHDDAGYFEASRCDSVMSFEDNENPGHPFTCSLASSSMTELNSLYSMGEDVSGIFLLIII